MKILVVGGTGMAGHTISLYFDERGHDVTVFSRRPFTQTKNIIGDAIDFPFLLNIVKAGEYDAIINCIGILNKDAENNKSRAILLNSYLPHFLSEITRKTNTKIIHMSTDCVFSGKGGLYTENSLRDGSTFYDRSKALGELENLKDLTFRNSIIGPDMNENGIGLFNWFMKQEGTVYGYTKAIWTGVTTLTLAKAMEAAIEQNLYGLYNLVNNEMISKYELLNLFNDNFKNSNIRILPNESVTINKSLVNTRTDFSFEVPSYQQMIIEMKNWVQNHKNIYTHYE